MPEAANELAPCVASCTEGIQYTIPETAAAVKLKMDHERWRYERVLSKINVSSKIAEEVCSKNVQLAKDEHLKLLAYAKVCQNHSFDKYDPFKDESLDEKKRRRKKTKTREAKLRPATFRTVSCPDRDNPDTLLNSPIDNEQEVLKLANLNRSFPQIASRECKDRETDNKSSKNSHFNALVMWKCAHQKLFKNEKSKERKIKEIPLTRKAKAKLLERPVRKNIFPGECKSQAALKRFMEYETEQMLQELTAPKHKKEDKIKKMVKKAQLPDLIRRDKTFSAIVRDFRSYKEEREEHKNRKMVEYVTRHFNHSTAF